MMSHQSAQATDRLINQLLTEDLAALDRAEHIRPSWRSASPLLPVIDTATALEEMHQPLYLDLGSSLSGSPADHEGISWRCNEAPLVITQALAKAFAPLPPPPADQESPEHGSGDRGYCLNYSNGIPIGTWNANYAHPGGFLHPAVDPIPAIVSAWDDSSNPLWVKHADAPLQSEDEEDKEEEGDEIPDFEAEMVSWPFWESSSGVVDGCGHDHEGAMISRHWGPAEGRTRAEERERERGAMGILRSGNCCRCGRVGRISIGRGCCMGCAREEGFW